MRSEQHSSSEIHVFFQSEFAVTRRRVTRGDDYDTFFQPTGDVVVAGTTGDVAMRSWRARQTIGLVPVQVPAMQVSDWLQALPSSHGLPSGLAGLEQAPLAVLQTPASWH